MASSSATSGLSTSGSIHFTGLGSGTDFDSMIDQLVEAEGYRVKQLQSWKQEWEDKIEAFQDLNTAMLDLKKAIEDFDTPNEFLVKSSASSNTAALTVTASSQASNGSHTVVVNQLAANCVLTSDGAAGATDATAFDISNGGGVFSYKYQGSTSTLTVAAGTTLTNLVNLINGDPNNPGVRASVLQVSSNDYRLQVSGMDLGFGNDIDILSDTTRMSLDETTDQTQAATNAQISVDGFPAGPPWIERSSNVIDDVVAGLSISLKGTGASTITTTTDTEAIKENVQSFVDAVNEVRSLIISQTKFDADSQKASLLTGNYGVQLISTKLKDLTATKASGFDYNLDMFSSLSQVGIKTDADESSSTAGLLILDETALDNALAADPDAVAKLFSAQYDGTADSTDFVFQSSLGALGVTKPGTYPVTYTVAGGVITAATINGQTASIDTALNTITMSSADDSKGLCVKVTNLADGSYSDNVRLKLGKVPDLVGSLKDLTNALNGPLAVLQRNYHDIIDSIDVKIESEQKRIAVMEQNMREKYARLEAQLGTYQNLQTQLSSSIAGLMKS